MRDPASTQDLLDLRVEFLELHGSLSLAVQELNALGGMTELSAAVAALALDTLEHLALCAGLAAAEVTPDTLEDLALAAAEVTPDKVKP